MTPIDSPRRPDRRRARTRRAVERAFIELVGEKGYAGLTVQEILDRADVGRSTFYTHFHSKEDLLGLVVVSICDHVLAPSAPEVTHDFTTRRAPVDIVEHMLTHVAEEGSAVRALLAGGTGAPLVQRLRQALTERVGTIFPDVLSSGGPRPPGEDSFLRHHLAGTVVEAILWWSDEGFRTPAGTVARRCLAVTEPLRHHR
ncbi:MAG: TetR/AcrR family transcriptional regulator [Actinomyces sp.]|uniref:TetR/AcrR family transcriptional regulator n=1 Tax=Actinomyces sp. TaxID=29317 RepID=UPI0026DBDEA7|nr:TetR/AcrR family transcriptional regulator [Actinomyces sp.]MDO4242436.1 TetR/AcrR family transcriptional regulator [Actinomyces sp.]